MPVSPAFDAVSVAARLAPCFEGLPFVGPHCMIHMLMRTASSRHATNLESDPQAGLAGRRHRGRRRPDPERTPEPLRGVRVRSGGLERPSDECRINVGVLRYGVNYVTGVNI